MWNEMDPMSAESDAPNKILNNHTISNDRLIQMSANAPNVGKKIILSSGICEESQYKNTMYELTVILL